MSDLRPCANPVCSRTAVHRYKRQIDLCAACYLYARRHDGTMRPADVIRASARRRVMLETKRARDRQLAAVGMVEQYAEPKLTDLRVRGGTGAVDGQRCNLRRGA